EGHGGSEEDGKAGQQRRAELAGAEEQDVALRQEQERCHDRPVEPRAASQPGTRRVRHGTPVMARESRPDCKAPSMTAVNCRVVTAMSYLAATRSRPAGRANGPRSCASSSRRTASAIAATSSVAATG